MLNKWLHLLQSLVARLKENLEKLTEERDQRSASENREKEQNKRLLRQIRDVKEEMAELAKKEAEASRKKHELVRSLLWLFTQPHVIPNQFDFFLLKNTKEIFWGMLGTLKPVDFHCMEKKKALRLFLRISSFIFHVCNYIRGINDGNVKKISELSL